MKSRTYKMLDGREIALDADPSVAAFVARVEAAASDTSVSNDAMTALIFGPDNPLLDHTTWPGMHMATKETLAHPAYRVLRDLAMRKEAQAGLIDLDKLRDRFFMTVTEAAQQLGISTSAVRQAIEAGKLESWKEGGQHRLNPRQVDALRVEHRGPAPMLEVCSGSAPGQSLRFKAVFDLDCVTTTKKGDARLLQGRLQERWERVAVIFGGADGYEFCELAPAGTDNELTFGPFYVRGRFAIVRRIQGPRAPHDQWKAFQPS